MSAVTGNRLTIKRFGEVQNQNQNIKIEELIHDNIYGYQTEKTNEIS